ncbi:MULTISPECIES: glycerol-3-phosphate transporter [unclassified Lentimicrobium]|uniref:glycerol-3-phosphate transporter n=1 Tax=unclassified Lentimicrobium TaxID=2677434 RepID=UPI001553B117|nr:MULTISPECIES: glycerol-3-phosphate transporter [unclassified Lentimicrobium]NPD47581.1 glycerol-3-phosphate transporter [Lentimicrobium sp. S6]NPD83615.1 glycerol-3-phosphate transporter [Lentimicrobium sp. L6]
MIGFLKTKPAQPLKEAQQADEDYKIMRLRVFLGIFLGYAAYYLVRKNFSLIMPDLIEEGYTKAQLGWALSAISIAYGISKFVMGSVSDRSNPKVFLSLGLILSAVTMMVMGLIPFFTSSVVIMFVLLFLNGWFQGMGWPACGRIMVHWFSNKERGTKMSIWNVAHNVGGGLIGPLAILGLAIFNDWHSALYFPAIIAFVIAILVYYLMEDTPQSCGLPSIEKWKNDYPENYDQEKSEQELKAKDIFITYVLKNRMLWAIAIANAFVYLIRYGVLDWAPTYLSETKGLDITTSGWAYFLYEWAGIPGTLLAGWLSDKAFKGQRAQVSIIYMFFVLIFVFVYWFSSSLMLINISLIAIGFLVYGPVMLIGVHALDLAPKKAAGTAAGFTGLFGYLGGALFANIAMGHIVDLYGWDGGFYVLIAAAIISIFLLLFTIKPSK